MAEVGVIASALQLADIGVRLSLRLYTFGETVASADKSIIAISEHVSLTSTVLKELGQTLDKDHISRICSPNAVQTADSIVKQCQSIFQEMEHVLVKKFANTKSTAKDRRIKAAQTLERLKWPFIKGKMDLLMSNLEKQKSTLVLMLNVIGLAKQEHERTEPYTIIARQRSLIEDLARSNEDYIRKYERLKLSSEEAPVDQESVPADWGSSMPTPKTRTAHRLASTLAVNAPSPRKSSADATGLDPEPYKGSHIPSFSSSDRLGWLIQQYNNLMRALLREVSAPNYEIVEESRSRIKADIVSTQRREMNILSQESHRITRSEFQGLSPTCHPNEEHGFLSLENSPTMHDNAEPKADLEQVSAPVQHVSTQDPNRHWRTSQSEANNLSSVAPSSNPFYETHTAALLHTPQAQAWPSENDDLVPEPDLQSQAFHRSSPADHELLSQPLDPEPASSRISDSDESSSRQTRKWSKTSSSVQPKTPLERLALQSGTQPKAYSSKRVLFGARGRRHAGSATANEGPSALQTGASEVTDIADYCQGSNNNAEERLERRLEDDRSKDWAEHIVDKLLATWTTLPLHASQTDPRHGSLAEAAH